MKSLFRIADLFCGAGGTSDGAMEAAKFLGHTTELTAVNHWPVAIDTHEVNHPAARSLCTGVDAVNPRDLFNEGELNLLWASPECTHHSIARGGKPINDQSRATAWCVIRWAESLLPPVILIENVPEFETWGPLIRKKQKTKVEVPSVTYRNWRRAKKALNVTDRKALSRITWQNEVEHVTREVQKLVWVPDPKRKGEIFRAWVATLEAIGYKVDKRLLCAADYGDPTTRTRLFVQAVRGRRKIVWPHPTHSKEPDLMTPRRWKPARDIIDWEIEGQSIYERKRPLSPKTMARIFAGLRKYGLKGFIVPQFGEREGQVPRTHDIDEPTPAVKSHGAGALVQPYIIPQCSNPTPKSVDEPLSTVLAEGSGPKLCEPFLIPQHSSNGPRSVDLPAPVVTTTSRGVGLAMPFLVTVANGGEDEYRSASVDSPLSTVTAGGVRHALAEPFIVAWDNQSGGPGGGISSIEDPISTVVTKARHGVAEPFLVNLRGSSPSHLESTSSSLNSPCGTVTANGTHLALAEPFLVNMKGRSDAADIDLPSPTLTAHSPHMYLAEPFLIQVAHGAGSSEDSRVKSLDSPMPVVCGNRGDMALIEPFIMSAGGPECGARSVSLPVGTILTRDHRALVEPFLIKTANGVSRAGEETRAKDLAEPAPTLTCSHDLALIEPHLLPQQSDGRLRPISEPCATVATSGAIALVEPFLISYYGNSGPQSTQDPLDTVTTKDRHALIRPIVEMDGQRYLLDIKFRMLQPSELALAQGFRKDYQFTGTKTDQVKQIGNAVPRRLARAIVAAAISQNPDVSALVEAEEARDAEMERGAA